MKIALSIMGDDRWMAGEVIVRDILLGVRELELKDTSLVMVTTGIRDEARLRARYSAATDYLHCPIPARFSRPAIAQRISTRLFEKDTILDEFLKGHGVDVLFGWCFLVGYPSVASLSWIPDFQHVHLPEMFSEAEKAERDSTFVRTARVSTRIVLLSQSVRKDFQTRLPQYAAKARVLSPVTRVSPSVYETNPDEMRRRYHLPEKFFYLPNQFWRHKNHQLVFEAVRDLKNRGTPVTVVCSGYPSDHRNIGHFASLCEKVSLWNIRDQIIYLGLVPHDDVLRLVRQSICVVNPSKFEGWGISVDEARSIGKQILASAIPAHLEQDPPKTTYFDPGNCQDLETKMADLWNNSSPGPDEVLERAARASLPGRIRKYAEKFIAISREAYESFHV